MSPDPIFVERGAKYMRQIRDVAIDLGKKLFKADYINIWTPTGHTANIVTFFAFCKPGDKVLVLAPEHGGYGGIAKTNLPECLGLETLYFPFDYDKFNINVEETIKLIEVELPSLIIFGATYFLFPHPIRELAQVAHNHKIPVAYDGAHVLGLIAGGQFQDPLREGADLLFGSTMKTLPGPPGGVLVTNSPEVHEKLSGSTWYKAVTSTQWNRIAAFGIAFEDMLRWGRQYAAQIIQNARALAAALQSRGVSVMYEELDYTASHNFLLDVGGIGKNVAGHASGMAVKLEEANIIIDDRGRIGVSEVTRIGMKEGDMETIAELMSKVLLDQVPAEEIRVEVREFRSKFAIEYCE
jgi:glycine hydroxymethyltransferase